MVFVVLFLGECELLDPPLGAPLRLLGLNETAMLVIELGLKILKAGLTWIGSRLLKNIFKIQIIS